MVDKCGGGEAVTDAADHDAWRITDGRLFLIYQEDTSGQDAGVMHMVKAKADHVGLCTPAASTTVCG